MDNIKKDTVELNKSNEMVNAQAIQPNIIEVVDPGTIEYTCEICEKNFDRKYNLDRHMRVHQQKVTNVVCSECSKTFANMANLKTHFIDMHKGKTMTLPTSAIVTNKGIAPVKMVDASTQTETETEFNGQLKRDAIVLNAPKWKDNLYFRYQLTPPSKKSKSN